MIDVVKTNGSHNTYNIIVEVHEIMVLTYVLYCRTVQYQRLVDIITVRACLPYSAIMVFHIIRSVEQVIAVGQHTKITGIMFKCELPYEITLNGVNKNPADGHIIDADLII